MNNNNGYASRTNHTVTCMIKSKINESTRLLSEIKREGYMTVAEVVFSIKDTIKTLELQLESMEIEGAKL